MSLNCRGYTFVELLMALHIIIVLTCVILPQFTLIMMERGNNRQLHTANDLLNEQIQLYFYEEDYAAQDSVIYKNNIAYRISWIMPNEDELGRVCIKWQDQLMREVERCGYV